MAMQTDYIGLSYQMFDAIIDAGGGGNFTSIGEAFASGAICVYVRNGVYNETSITLPEGFCLIGESAAGVFINFSSGGFVYDGSGGTKETAGSITQILGGSTALQGTGTTFTNLSSGNFISIYGTFYEIASVTNNTNLVLVREYEGVNTTGATVSYVGQSMFQGGSIENCTMSSPTGTTVFFRGVQNCSLNNVAIVSSNLGIQIVDCGSIYILGCVVEDCVTQGIDIDTSFGVQVVTTRVSNNDDDGININSGEFSQIIVDNCIISNNSDGIEVANGENIVISDCQLIGNAGEGIETNSASSLIVINGCYLDKNNRGASIQSTKTMFSNNTVTNSVLSRGVNFGNEFYCVGNTITNNLTDGLSATTTISRGNFSFNYIADNGGDGISLGGGGLKANFTFIGNTIEGNTAFGVDLANGTFSEIILKDNQVFSNTGGNYNFNSSARAALQGTEEMQIVFNANAATTSTNFGLFPVPWEANITSIFMSLLERGDTGNTVFDVFTFSPSIVQGTTDFNATGTTIYTTTGNRPDIAGDTANATQNAFLYATDPDVVEIPANTFLGGSVVTETTNTSEFVTVVNLKRIPQ